MECKYCKEKTKNNSKAIEIWGLNLEMHKTAGYKEDCIKYRCWIAKLTGDEKAGIMVSTDNGDACYFDINYCPICGRKV